MNKTAIIYCRVSTIKQRNEWESLDNQEKACRNYCKNNDTQVMWVYKEAFTWKSKNRPILKEAFKNAIENKINYFIIFDIDRFSREWYGVYSELKDELSKNWVQLKDSKNIIWDSHMVFKNDLVDMSQYKWNIENNSEYAEVMFSTQAKIEWKKIIQRTIPREIQLEQEWYQVRQSNYWYQNKRISTNNGKKTIQEKHIIEWDFVIEIFENRAKWTISDSELVEQVNLKWCKKRDWKPMSVKYLQELIKKPIYAWIISTKWTWKPIKSAFKWLVEINIWNKANRWKYKIIEIDDKEVIIEYKNKNEEIKDIPIIEKRKNYNNDFPYSKVLKCPICSWYLTPNNSKSADWSIHPYYQCRWKNWNKHQTYTIKRDESHNKIEGILSTIKINEDALNLFDLVSEKVFEERKEELKNDSVDYDKYLNELNKREKNIIDNIDKFLHLDHILEIKNKELEEIKTEKYKIELKRKQWDKISSLDKFKYHSKKLITHIDKLALQRDKPEIINLVFDIVFDWKIEYEKINSHTNFFHSFWANLSQQKNPSCDEFSLNSKWHPH